MKLGAICAVTVLSLLFTGVSLAQGSKANDGTNSQNNAASVQFLKSLDLSKVKLDGFKVAGEKATVINNNQTPVEPGAGTTVEPQKVAGENAAVSPGPIGFAAAPPLSQMAVLFVCSANLGPKYTCEQINSGQVGTTFHDGGSYVTVIVGEIGYGDNPVATMNGSVLPSSALIAEPPICQDFSGNLTTNCQAGETVVGFEHWYDVTAFQNGRFTYQNTSTNSPFNTLSTFIQVN